MPDMNHLMNPGAYARQLKRLSAEIPLAIRQGAQGRRDAQLAVRAIPALRAFRSREPALVEQLRVPHEEYVRTVSTNVMAITLEYAVLIRFLAEALRPSRILDTGSGFSSFVLRTPFEDGTAPEVWSVDDNEHWLEATRTYLDSKGLTTDNVMAWDRFVDEGIGEFDLISHDLGSMETRARTLPVVIDRLAPTGWLVLDDIDKPEYASSASRTLTSAGCPSCSLRAITLADRSRERWEGRPFLQPRRFAYLVGAPGTTWA